MTDHAAQGPAAPVAFTQRGFGIWSEFTDRYGQKVTVVDSSLATEACVWVQPADGQNIHLNEIQATELRDALTAWLTGPEFTTIPEPDLIDSPPAPPPIHSAQEG